MGMGSLHEARAAKLRKLLWLLKKWREGDDYRAHVAHGHPALRIHDAKNLAAAFDAYEETLPEKIDI
jgi:hypothetical protein